MKEEIYRYLSLALADRSIKIIQEEKFCNAMANYFRDRGYGESDIAKAKVFANQVIYDLKQWGYENLSQKELDEFFNYEIDTGTNDKSPDQSSNYTEGIYRGQTTYVDKRNKDNEPVYEDDDIRIIHLGTLSYDNNQESVEKYRVLRIGKMNDVDICYTNINGLFLAKDEAYRKAVKEQLLDYLNISNANCMGYIGELEKIEEKDGTVSYKINYDKMALTAVIDYEKDKAEKLKRKEEDGR